MRSWSSIAAICLASMAFGQAKPRTTSATRPMPMPMPPTPTRPGDNASVAKKAPAKKPSTVSETRPAAFGAIREYLHRVTVKRQQAALADIVTKSDWESKRPQLQRQLLQMLGLDPMPERGDLKATVTGKIERPGLVIEKLHFQSSPGLYVTANFYRPAKIDKPLPTVLYLCGHHKVVVDGKSCGNKTHYQHHPLWFARNGYCCLIIDTLQLGEVEGEHHGTYRLGKWWWMCRGYTPAGVEAWNALRSLDYLATRPEVDMKRLGVTGRSGGGIYSWWLAAIDDRPVCIAPVAGLTDLENYVVDDCIEGHCDCMFLANAYGWDYPMVAALSAPRAVLFCNSDKDKIFPLTGVERSHAKLRKLYETLGAGDKLGLVVTEGPHLDTQELQVPVFRWMNRWLRDETGPVYPIADAPIPPGQLSVFKDLPADAINGRIDHDFVRTAKQGPVPETLSAWQVEKTRLVKDLNERTFRSWPEVNAELDVQKIASHASGGLVLDAYEFISDENLRLPFYVVRGEGHAEADIVVVNVLNETGWMDWLASLDRGFVDIVPDLATAPHRQNESDLQRRLLTKNAWAFVALPPRGIGPNKWKLDAKATTHLLRRFYLLGKTVDDGRIWDVRRAVGALESLPAFKASRIWLQGDGQSAGIALYAGIYEKRVERMDLHHLPISHMQGPILLNVLQTLDIPQAVALAFPKRVVLYDVAENDFAWAAAVAKLHGGVKSLLEFRRMPTAKSTGR